MSPGGEKVNVGITIGDELRQAGALLHKKEKKRRRK